MFENCAVLESVKLSASDIGSWAFRNCKKLSKITYSGTVEEWKAGSKGYEWKDGLYSYCKVKCSDDEISAYAS